MATSQIPTDQPPDSFTREQKEWLNRMFKQARLSDQNSDILTPLTSLPDRPITNKLYWFAKPIPAANIAYEGVYIYKSDGRWWALADLACGASWEDNIGDLSAARSVGSGSANYFAINGIGRFPHLNQGPLGSITLQTVHHIKHDSKEGEWVYPHVHFTNDAAEIAGASVTFDINVQLAAGHDQANFPVATLYQVPYVVGAGGRAQWRHFIAEGTSTAQAFQAPEVDSIAIVTTSINATTFAGRILGILVDLHYQRDRISTVAKAPDFYT